MKSLTERFASLSPKQRRVLERRLVERGLASSDLPIPRRTEDTDTFPLSFAQERQWFLDQLDPGTPAYNIPTAVPMTGRRDAAILERCFNAVVQRHEALRTTFRLVGGEPVQTVAAELYLPLPVVDLSALPEARRQPLAGRLVTSEMKHSFDLSRGPLLRTTLVRLGPEEHMLAVVMHHIVSDGWSINVLVREVTALYQAFAAGTEARLPALEVQYPDYALWQREWLGGSVLNDRLGYWREQLAGCPPLLPLPTDRPRPAVQSFRGASLGLRFPAELTAALKAAGRRLGTTLFTFELAALGALLYRITGQRDLCVGTFTANRDRVAVENLIGFFVNTLVLRTDLGGVEGAPDPTFQDLLRQAQDVTLGAFTHQEVPFEMLLKELDPERDPSHTPLFQVMLTLQPAGADVAELEQAVAAGGSRVPKPVRSNFDFTLWTHEHGSGILVVQLDYSTDLFDTTTMCRFLDQMRSVLAAAAAAPELRLSELPLISAAERHQLLREWNDTAAAAARPAAAGERPVHELFAAAARRRAGAPAVVAAEGSLTYGELDRRADRLAARLQELGVGPEVAVGLLLERSPEMVVAMLAVLKAGGAYLPLDPAYPAERLRFMLRDAAAPVLLTHRGLGADLPAASLRRLDLDDEEQQLTGGVPRTVVRAEQPAYVIYTSGSTGEPKGVVVRHGALASYVAGAVEAYGLSAADRVLQFASISFDISVEEIFPTLACGAALHLRDEAMGEAVEALVERSAAWGITVINLPTAFWHEWAAALTEATLPPPSTRLVIIGGEAARAEPLAAWRRQVGEGVRLFNTYGPTEGTIVSTRWELPAAAQTPREVPIGRPVAGVRTVLLDRGLRPVPIGARGELCLGGAGLARGYLGRPAITAERFVPDPQGDGGRLYRTGDLARAGGDGQLTFLGRGDQQVKLRGFRIELGEIEGALEGHPAVREAAVLVVRGQRLTGWIVPAEAVPEETDLAADLRGFLAERLPTYMVPVSFAVLERLPTTPGGKVDRAALARSAPVPAGTGGGAAPSGEVEEKLAAIWCELLEVEQVGLSDNFFDLGGHSLLLVRLRGRLRETFGRDVPTLDLFRHPTIGELARAFRADPEEAPAAARPPRRRRRADAGGEIAIVGMACRFPGAADIDSFWDNLCAGVESIERLSAEALTAAGVPPQAQAHPDHVAACPWLDDIDLFDAAFFDVTPRDATTMDPQQRVFLEVAWEALEHAGCDPETFPGAVGVYAGLGMDRYLRNLMSNPQAATAGGGMQMVIGNDKDFMTTRLSYKLGLTGPSMAVQTACSTSLVAAHLACRSLAAGECDLALAGAVSLIWLDRTGYFFEAGGIVSKHGHNRAFDARADGTVFGNGAGVVVLRRLEEALAAGDTVHAVIKGSALNNDGSQKIGFTAPSIQGQAEVVADAIADAGVEPATIGYVEAHGTGTALGDPIEVAALSQVFGRQEGHRCALGTVKSNLGHLDTAAGVAGLIKAALALERRRIPPSLHYETPNPEIDFAGGPFFVNTELAQWPAPAAGGPHRAGVSAFGIGGTNAHLVLEEAPPLPETSPSRPWQLLLLSAKSATALDAMAQRLARHLGEHPELDLADVAFTLRTGRKAFAHRRTVVAKDPPAAAAALRGEPSPGAVAARSGTSDGGGRPVAFLFPGQGAQHVGMAAELHRDEPVFRDHLDRCCELLQPALGLDLRQLLYPPEGEAEAAAEQLRRTELTQPALFAVELALARQWMAWGVRPAAMVGHSIGEYVAACLAGVFSLEDALALVAERGRLMGGLPPGTMLAVGRAPEAIEPLLGDELSLAAINGPERCVVSGPETAVAAFEQRLAGDGHGGLCRRLHTSHAFHSPMVEPILEPFRRRLAAVELRPPELPFVAGVSGTWITAEEATDPAYWVRQLRRPVRFAAALDALFADRRRVLLEVGPGRSLSSLARRHPVAREASGALVVASLPEAKKARETSDLATVLSALGRLWAAGAWRDRQVLGADEQRRKLALPTYPFEGQRYWIEMGEAEASRPGPARSRGRAEDLADWFYAPCWKPAELPAAVDAALGPVLLLLDGHGLGEQLGRRLAEQGEDVVRVRPGTAFAGLTEESAGVDPGRREDWGALFAALRQAGRLPRTLVHLGGVTGPSPPPEGGEGLLEAGFYSLLHLFQALADEELGEPLRLVVVSDGMQPVAAGEAVVPEKAAALGPCRVIAHELDQLSSRSVDVPVVEDWSAEPELLAQLADELAADVFEVAVAYRGGRRWVEAFEPVRLEEKNDVPARLRRRGCYLITGGTGGLGLACAHDLARTVEARLILVGRTALPPRADWEAWIGEHGEDHPMSRKLRFIASLEELGAEVMTVAADVADRGALAAAVAAGRERFGAIHGVLHTAGVPGIGLAQLKTRQAVDRVLRPKVRGTRVLEAVFAGQRLDFLVLFSSVVSSLGGLGQVDYCAANAFLDAFAHARNAAGGGFTVAVGWGTWQQVGMAVSPEVLRAQDQQYGDRLQIAIRPEEGVAALRRILERSLPQVVVEPQDFQRFLEQSREVKASRVLADLVERTAAGTLYPRPELESPYVAPRGEVEEALAEIWQGLLGIERVGVDDDLFELGGDSLLATQMLSRVRGRFQVELPLQSLFESPTVAQLAAVVGGEEKQEDLSVLEDLFSNVEEMSESEARSSLQETGTSGDER